MSREVMGALDDASAPAEGRTGSLTDTPDLGPATLRLDDDPVDHGRVAFGAHPPGPASATVDAASDLGPAQDQRSGVDRSASRADDAQASGGAEGAGVGAAEGAGDAGVRGRRGGAADLWLSVRDLVQHPRSRAPAVALVVVAALVGCLLGIAVAQRIALTGREQNVSVSAWLTHDQNSFTGLQLFVVNSGQTPLTVTSADLEGEIEGGLAPVDIELQGPIELDPGKAGKSLVTVTSECDAGPLSPGGARDGRLRVTVATQDLREQVVSASSLAGLSLTSVEVYEMVCSQEVYEPDVFVEFGERADGRLGMTARSEDGDDHVLDLTAPDGITFETEPALPLQLTGIQGQGVALSLTVEACTQNNTQLLAGQQVQLEVDDEPAGWNADLSPLWSWYAREVGRACDT